MRQLGFVYLFNWYAMFIYWQFITLCLARTIYQTSDQHSEGFAKAQVLTGTVNGAYNIVTFCVAFVLAFLAGRLGAKTVHAVSLCLAGLGLILLPSLQHPALLVIPMIGFGIGWASMMGTPYILLAGQIPSQRTGVYMGILNMFIVLPMMLETLTFGWIYKNLLTADPTLAIRFAGVMILVAALLTLRISVNKVRNRVNPLVFPAEGH
jgi:maltose/moltooligosaccharide transporter